MNGDNNPTDWINQGIEELESKIQDQQEINNRLDGHIQDLYKHINFLEIRLADFDDRLKEIENG